MKMKNFKLVKKIRKTWQKNKRAIRNLGLTGLIIGGLLFPKIAKAGGIGGYVWDAHDGTSSEGTVVSCWINKGSSGTLKDTVDVYGIWSVDSGNFTPPPSLGDTVKMSGELDTGTKVYKTHMRRIYDDSNVILPTAFLDDTSKDVRAHDFGVWYVKDTSNVDDTLRAEGWLQKNPDQKIPYVNYFLKKLGDDSTLVDTSETCPQVAINLEKQDFLLDQGDSVIVRLYKTKNDTTWFSDTTFALDTMKYGCATLLDTIVFPEGFDVFKDVSSESTIVDTLYTENDIVSPKAGIKNKGTIIQIPRAYFFIRDSADGTQVYKDSLDVSLSGGKDSIVTFSDWTAAVGTYAALCSLSLDGDDSLDNNVSLKYFKVQPSTGLENTISGFFAYPSYEGVKLGIALDIHTSGEGRKEIKIQKRKAERENGNGVARNGNYRDLTSIVAEHPAVSYLDKDVEKGENYDYRAIFNKDTLYASVFVPNSFFKVWPTITTGKIHVKGAKEFEVYDLSGRKVKTYGANSANSTGSTGSGVYNFDLPQGVYFLRPKDSESGESRKVVKVK